MCGFLCIKYYEPVALWHYSLQDNCMFLCMFDIQIFIKVCDKLFGRILMNSGLLTTYILEQNKSSLLNKESLYRSITFYN